MSRIVVGASVDTNRAYAIPMNPEQHFRSRWVYKFSRHRGWHRGWHGGSSNFFLDVVTKMYRISVSVKGYVSMYTAPKIKFLRLHFYMRILGAESKKIVIFSKKKWFPPKHSFVPQNEYFLDDCFLKNYCKKLWKLYEITFFLSWVPKPYLARLLPKTSPI